MGAAVWGSPYYVDGKIYMGDENGHVVVFTPGKEKKIINTMDMGGAVWTTPVAANGVLLHQHPRKALRHPARGVHAT